LTSAFATWLPFESSRACRLALAAGPEGPRCDSSHGWSARHGQRFEQISDVVRSHDQNQAVQRLSRQKRVSFVDQTAQRVRGRAFAALAEYLCRDHLRSGQRMPERPDQLV
jgi:hypothetical protein